MTQISTRPLPASRASFGARVLAGVALLVVLLVGLWVFAGALAPGYVSSIALGGAWFVAVGVASGRLARRRPDLKLALRGTFLVVVLACAFGFYWTSIRDDVVREQVVAGVAESRLPAAEAAGAATRPPPAVNVTESTGAFETLAHSSGGTASVVRLAAGGRFLTFTDFRTNNGPDLRVRLVAGTVNDNGDGDGSIDLGALKGNVGDQQYAIAKGTDLARYGTVVIWCRAFTVGFARARLVAA